MYRRTFCGFLCLAGPTAGAYGQAPKDGRIVLGTALDIRDSAYGRRLILLYEVALMRLGLELVVVVLPSPRRLSIAADSGQIDGELTRYSEYGLDHPNLVRVQEPHEPLLFAAYSTQPGLLLKDWDDLAGTDYRVGYRAGLTLSEKRLHSVMASWRTVGVASVEIGLKMLRAQRFDLFVDTEPSLEYVIARERPDGRIPEHMIFRAGTLESSIQHLYLHIKHKDLAVALASELRSLKQLTYEQLSNYRSTLLAR